MKLSDIKIFQWGYGKFQFVPEDEPSKLTLCFLASLIHSPYFIEQVKYFRDEYGIPDEGISHEHLLQTHEPYLYEQIKEELKSLTFYYDLPFPFIDRFYLLIAFNAFIDIPEEEFPNILYATYPADIQTLIDESEEWQENVSAILIDHKVTKEQLHKWIDDEWSYIEKEMKEALPSFPLEGKKFTNIELTDEIYTLAENDHSLQEISDMLSNKYPDNPYVSDEGWIKNKLARYKQWINKIAKKYASLERNQPDE